MARTIACKMNGLARLAAGRAVAGLAIAGLAALPTAASAQTMKTNSASYNAGYGRYSGQENQPVDTSLRDANGNLTVINGQISGAFDFNSFASASASGDASAYGGVGGSSGAATAVGNSLNVVTTGSYNTVIVSSTQTNTGAITATTTVNGGANGH